MNRLGTNGGGGGGKGANKGRLDCVILRSIRRQVFSTNDSVSEIRSRSVLSGCARGGGGGGGYAYLQLGYAVAFVPQALSGRGHGSYNPQHPRYVGYCTSVRQSLLLSLGSTCASTCTARHRQFLLILQYELFALLYFAAIGVSHPLPERGRSRRTSQP